MKRIIFFQVIIISFLYSSCNNNKPGDQPGISSNADTAAISDTQKINYDEFLIPYPEVYYQPAAGLKPLNLADMFIMVQHDPESLQHIELRDKNGEPTNYLALRDPNHRMFCQLFANDSNRVVIGILYEMTPEIQQEIFRMRKVLDR
jgi:hypothetical protein